MQCTVPAMPIWANTPHFICQWSHIWVVIGQGLWGSSNTKMPLRGCGEKLPGEKGLCLPAEGQQRWAQPCFPWEGVPVWKQ